LALNRTSTFANGFGIINESQVFNTQALLSAYVKRAPSARRWRAANNTGPGLATYFGPRGPSHCENDGDCLAPTDSAGRAVRWLPPRLLDPRAAAKPSLSIVRAMYSSVKAAADHHRDSGLSPQPRAGEHGPVPEGIDHVLFERWH